MKEYINSKTLIPLGSLGVLIITVFWIGVEYETINENKHALVSLHAEIAAEKSTNFEYRKRIFDRLNNIDKNLSKIEGIVLSRPLGGLYERRESRDKGN